MSWQTEVEQTITGLGYVLIEIERSSDGLLRIYIEHPQGVPAITVDDCERVTRQLQFVLEVQQVEYQRLEVSSPGLDRLLISEQDFDRFIGELVVVTFKQALDMTNAQGESAHKQKKFTGRLSSAQEGQNGWVLVIESDPVKSKKHTSKKKTVDEEPTMAIGFTYDEVREARLVPVVDFKGKKTIENPKADTENEVPADKPFNKNGDLD